MTTMATMTTAVRTHTDTGFAGLPEIVDPQTVAPRDARDLSTRFFAQLAVLEEGTPEYQYARNTLIEMNMSLVRYAAGRFRHRGDDMEDIVQVGMIGLIKAIDRFELSREVEFTSFAVPYIVGEIKRFFRDTTWAVHVPRRLAGAARRARQGHRGAQHPAGPRLRRSPNCAALMNLTEDEVIEGPDRLQRLQLHLARRRPPRRRRPRARPLLADFIGEEDPAMELVEDFHALAPLIAELDDRDRRSSCSCASSRSSPSRRSANTSACPRCMSPAS